MIDPVRTGALARKEWIQLRRDPRSMILAFVLPLFLLLFFGYAITWDVDDIPLAVLDRNGSQESRSLVQALVSSGYFTMEARIASETEATDRLARGDVRGALVIPPPSRASSRADGGHRCSSSSTAATPTPRRSRSTTPTRS